MLAELWLRWWRNDHYRQSQCIGYLQVTGFFVPEGIGHIIQLGQIYGAIPSKAVN